MALSFNPGIFRAITLAFGLVMLLGLLLARALPVQAAGVVTDCSNDAQLRSMLAGGGAVTFNCNGNGSPATIVVSPSIVITTGLTTLDGGNKVTLSGAQHNRIFYVDAGVFGSPLGFTLRHIVLANGDAGTGYGGCLAMGFFATVLLDDVTVQHCRTENNAQGGGIYNALGNLTLVSSRVLTNSAGAGGGIS
ncbi:MAG: hypothetical protein E6J26_06670, partial [Chloroflexi bacterium]